MTCVALHCTQDAFLQQTEEYYAAEGARLMQELDVADYLLHCEVSLWCRIYTVEYA